MAIDEIAEVGRENVPSARNFRTDSLDKAKDLLESSNMLRSIIWKQPKGKLRATEPRASSATAAKTVCVWLKSYIRIKRY